MWDLKTSLENLGKNIFEYRTEYFSPGPLWNFKKKAQNL